MEFATLFMGVVGLACGVPAGYFIDKWISQKTLNEAKTLADRILDEARKEASAHKKEMVLAAHDELFRQKQDLEKDYRDRGQALRREGRTDPAPPRTPGGKAGADRPEGIRNAGHRETADRQGTGTL